MKLVFLSIIVISGGSCLGFPDGSGARDSRPWEPTLFKDSIESAINVDSDQHLQKGKEVIERESRGGGGGGGGKGIKKILKMLMEELQDTREHLTETLSKQNAEIDYLNSAISNQSEILESSRAVLMEELQATRENLTESFSKQNAEIDYLNSAISNQSEMLDSSRVCPEGFFRCIPTSQCFKYFTDEIRNWTQADAKCRAENLTLAQPLDPVSVRSYLITNYVGSYAWVGARGDGNSVVWQRGGQAISNETKSQFYSTYIRVDSTYCLVMLSYSSLEIYKPNNPYLSYNCSATRPYTLCELTME